MVLAAAFPCAAGAVPVNPVTQVGAPVQIESCSAQALNSTAAPAYGHFSTAVLRDSTGKITYVGPAVQSDQQIPMAAMYNGTRVYGSARSVNGSGQAVTGVVYQFNVLGPHAKTIASFYGPLSGVFTQNARITPPGWGMSSPWTADLTQPDVESVSCFVAYVRFSDGTSWLSPMATIPQALQSSP